jgi:hypothetical protein
MWAATATMICRQAGEIDDVEYEILLKNLISRRDWAADKAAPYIHPRLSSIENKERSDHEGWLHHQ